LPQAFNPLLSYPKARLLVAESNQPEGPYRVVNFEVNLAASGPGDFTLFYDKIF